MGDMSELSRDSGRHRPGFKKTPDECLHVVVDEWWVDESLVATRCCDCGEEGV